MTAAPPRRRAWSPEADDETTAALRWLMVQPWLVTGRDDEMIATVRRNAEAVRDVLGRLGWVLVIERDLVRLRKSPPPRRHAWAADGPHPRTCSWFFLLVAAGESMPPRIGLSTLVDSARSAAAEAGIQITGDIGERRAIAAAIRELERRGVVEQIEGDVAAYVRDETSEVLLAVHHGRLVYVIANVGPADPDRDPQAWLRAVEHESDSARRMRRRLIDDAVVHAADLDDAEADWLSRRVRGDDGEPLAAAFGLRVERRSEGAAFVVPDDTYRHPYELGPLHLPANGTVPHAAMLLCRYADEYGTHEDGPGPGWRGLGRDAIRAHLIEQCEIHGSRWKDELIADLDAFLAAVERLLGGLGLLRTRTTDGGIVWWFSPATARWDAVPTARPRPVRRAVAHPDLAGRGTA